MCQPDRFQNFRLISTKAQDHGLQEAASVTADGRDVSLAGISQVSLTLNVKDRLSALLFSH